MTLNDDEKVFIPPIFKKWKFILMVLVMFSCQCGPNILDIFLRLITLHSLALLPN